MKNSEQSSSPSSTSKMTRQTPATWMDLSRATPAPLARFSHAEDVTKTTSRTRHSTSVTMYVYGLYLTRSKYSQSCACCHCIGPLTQENKAGEMVRRRREVQAKKTFSSRKDAQKIAFATFALAMPANLLTVMVRASYTIAERLHSRYFQPRRRLG